MSQPIAPGMAWAGVGIAEDIASIRHGVENGSWIDGSLGVVGAGLDTLALVSDPLGVLMQYGVAWIIEHVRPLTEALDQLAGDPAAIAGATATWRDIAAGHPYPQTDADVPPFEDRAYAYEEYWWNNQPIRPEPKAR
ncbi:hypothetical protein [Actinoplanes rectilineatus]|uniref:hypothetical protein n=1 Tax=Actinoplanes rectilineatus TaxID=113571 RepID=UPI000AF91323|nr:hypothetical protein [Actinoplanes rectilineatus]